MQACFHIGSTASLSICTVQLDSAWQGRGAHRPCDNKSGGDHDNRRRPLWQPNVLLLLGRAQGLPGFAHVFARLLDGVPFLLLGLSQDRADLRPEIVADGFHFLLRFLAGRLHLGPGLLEDRADLRLLLGREVEVLRHVLEGIAPFVVTLPVPARILLRGLLGVAD